jgi:GTP cyclohydrolase IA
MADRGAGLAGGVIDAVPHLYVVTANLIDLDAASRAVSDLLAALGQDTSSADVADTPRRAAAAMADSLTPTPFTMTTFANDGEYDEMVIARDISFHFLCAHHLLPFIGVAHVGYVPGDRIVGLSKLARLVEHFSRRLQTQERLTTQLAEALHETLAPRGAGVVLEAEHMCMFLRGVQARGTRTVTTSVSGLLRDDPATRAEFLALTTGPPSRART